MKNILILFVIVLFTSCNNTKISKEEVIDKNTYLIGNWSGEGRFFDVDFNKKVGTVPIEIEIKNNYEISGSIGDSELINMTIQASNYGFEIKGVLSSQIKKGLVTNKDHVVILLVLPETDRENVESSEANIHLKTNYSFDFTMRVGGVMLIKK